MAFFVLTKMVNTKMKTKALLIPLFAICSLLLVSFVSAGELATGVETRFNDVSLTTSGMTMAGAVGDTVPVRVTFEAIQNMSDVRVKVSIEGTRDDVEASTSRFNIIYGVVYTKLLSLELPSDLKDLDKEFTLYVEIVSADDRTEKEYSVRMQRETYDLEILSVDYNSQVSAGDVLPVVVVVKNTGYERADDNYVVVSIPELGVSSRGYAGDLVPTENCDDDCDDEEDSVLKTVYLQIPANAVSGVYDLEIKVSNSDSSTSLRKLVNIGADASTQVFASVKTQDIKAGETKTYDLVVVNSGDDVKVFNVMAVSGSALSISVPSVVTVGPKSSATIPVSVTASDDADIGTYTFSVDVNGEQVVLGANVTGGSVSASVVALTVVLVVVFVVLLVVLIVLLTRKESPIEEVETSYY